MAKVRFFVCFTASVEISLLIVGNFYSYWSLWMVLKAFRFRNLPVLSLSVLILSSILVLSYCGLSRFVKVYLYLIIAFLNLHIQPLCIFMNLLYICSLYSTFFTRSLEMVCGSAKLTLLSCIARYDNCYKRSFFCL